MQVVSGVSRWAHSRSLSTRNVEKAFCADGFEALSEEQKSEEHKSEEFKSEPFEPEQSKSEQILSVIDESARVELDVELDGASIPAEVLHEVCRHALDAAPEECCGLVLGTDDAPSVRSVRITNIMTKKHFEDPIAFPRNALHAYYMSEIEYQRAIEEAEASSECVRAIYHSHVEQGCYLSQDDLAFAVHPLFPFPEASQIVVSILGEDVEEVGIFDRVVGQPTYSPGRRLLASSGDQED